MNSLEKKYLMEHINSLIEEKVNNLEEIIRLERQRHDNEISKLQQQITMQNEYIKEILKEIKNNEIKNMIFR